MLGSTLHHRYRVEAELGRGGMGSVYRAYDTVLDRPVAVKVLSDSGLGTEGRARLLNEARAAAKLDHPNIVAVHDAGETENTPFIVMQLVEGESLHARHLTDLDKIIGIARQVCAALDHAHAHGIIHRDLKPENVIITPEGLAKLMDFGLARSSASRLTSEGVFIGTVFYLAPEQALGREIDHRVDLYSLGVVLYELAAGRLPFVADDPVAVISQHLHAPVVPPSTYNPKISPALDTLISKLLAKDPAHRFASASEVRQALESLDSRSTATQAAEEVSPIERIVRGRLVARERELAEATDHWRQAVKGEGRVLLISGEPGIGKTRLVRELLTLAEVAGGAAFIGECYAEGDAPYAPIARIIQSVMQANSHTPALPNLILADLLTLAPALRARFPDIPPNPPLEPQAEQQRLFESVVALCAALATRAPMLMVIDDAHWADGGTLALVRHLARRAQRSQLRLLIVLTYREVELAEARTLNTVLADLNHERLAERLKLTRLSREQTSDLLAALFQEGITPEFLDGIYHETEGNPFFVEEVCKALIEEGKVYREGGQWRRPAMTEIRVPQSVRVAIETRVGKLAEPIQETLRFAAILGRKFDFETLQVADDQRDEERLVEALEQAERAQLVAEVGHAGGGTFEFAHALIPATLAEGVSGLRRRRLHKRAASAIERLRPDDYEALAYHCAQAADDDRARTFYIQAADRAKAVYANDEAIRFYTEALTLTSATDASRFDLLAARAKVYDIVARREQQRADIDAMLALAEKLNNDARRCDALIALADLHLATDVVHAGGTAQRALVLARQLNDRVREGRALQRAGHALWTLFKWEESRLSLEASVTCFRDTHLADELAASLSLLSLAYRDLLELTAAQNTLDEVIALTRQIGDKSQEGTALRRKAIVLNGLLDRPTEALPLIEAALALHRTTGNRREEADSLNIYAATFLGLRQFEVAQIYFRQFLELSELVGYSEGVEVAVSQLTFVHIIIGEEYEAGLKLREDALNRARQQGDEHFIDNLNSSPSKATLWSLLGQHQAAFAVALDRVVFAEKSLGITAQGYALLDIALYRGELGQHAQAYQAFDQAWEKLTHPEVHPMERTGVWVWRAYVNWLEGTPDSLNTGLDDAQRATALLATLEIPYRYPLAHAHLHAARLHLALNAPEAALAAATEALRVGVAFPYFDVFGMKFHFIHSRALRANGHAAAADMYLQKAYDRVMLVAGKLKDETLRRSWLENVRDNREIIAEWEARQ